MKRLICIFLVLLIIYFFSIPKEKETIVQTEIQKTSFPLLKMQEKDKITEIELEDYVIGVVACEMPASFEIEALKAQSVASRTFILEKIFNNSQYIIDESTSGQCYNTISEMQEKWNSNYNNYYNRIKNSVYETKGEYITYKNKIIKSYYFSTSNGYTENVANVFGEKLDYLVSVESSWDKSTTSYEQKVTMSTEEFLEKLNIAGPINNINIDNRNETNRIEYVIINNEKIKGTTFRKLLNLRSTDFDIENDKTIVTITTRGYGHGVGLSQYGSNGMALEGYEYKEILQYYYKNTEINNV